MRKPVIRVPRVRRWLAWGIVGVALGGSLVSAGDSRRLTTTVYVGKHFEVRDHDEAVKYVFDGETRVARITGSLSGNTRVQRLRLWAGWNLVSLAVTAADFLGQIQRADPELGKGFSGVYREGTRPGEYLVVEAGETISAGTIVWLRANREVVVGISGQYVEPTPRAVPAGGGYVSGPGLKKWPVELTGSATGWRYDAEEGRWQAGLREALEGMGDLPSALAPGEVIYVQSDSAFELAPPEPAHDMVYYHQDHLGSSSVISDAGGRVVQETAYYPFGATRHEARSQPVESYYGFTQKERDVESRLHYFEARYLASVPGRFVSVDPRLSEHRFGDERAAAEFLANPQRLNHYAYAVNNPLRYIDPLGEDIQKPRKEKVGEPLPKGMTVEFRARADGPVEMELSVESIHQGNVRNPGGVGAASAEKAKAREFTFTMRSGAHTARLMEKMAKGEQVGEVTIVMRAPDAQQGGREREWTRIKLTDVMISSFSVTGVGASVDQFTLVETAQEPANARVFEIMSNILRNYKETTDAVVRKIR